MKAPETEAVDAELQRGKREYLETLEEAKKKLLAAFDAQRRRLEANTRLNAEQQIQWIDALEQEKRDFEADVTSVPQSTALRPAVRAYQSSLAKARAKCEAAFDKAAGRHKKLKNLSGARAVLTDRETFFDQAAGGRWGAWRPLFNGKDRKGWRTEGDAVWSVNGGILEVSGPWGLLSTEEGDFSDFHLRFEATINEGGWGGVFFRRQPAGNMLAYYCPISGMFGPYDLKTGSLEVGVGPAKDGRDAYAKLASPPSNAVVPQKPFKVDIIAVENRFKVLVDGKLTAEVSDPKKHYSRGCITLFQSKAGTVSRFRKIELRERLKASAAR